MRKRHSKSAVLDARPWSSRRSERAAEESGRIDGFPDISSALLMAPLRSLLSQLNFGSLIDDAELAESIVVSVRKST
jgi:hypothetical protein